jgi:alpha,alpha-trehalase
MPPAGTASADPARAELPPGFVTLDDLGVIGNLHTAALVSRHGSVDWACLPRFASPSVFARLLDPHRGGHHLVAPREPYRSEQRYRRATCVLETVFDLGDGRRLRVTDLMPVVPDLRPEGAPMILREAVATGGPVPVRTEFAPRFDYARLAPIFRPASDGVVAQADGVQFACAARWRFRAQNGTASAAGVLEDGERLEIELRWGGARPVATPFVDLVRETERFWRGWTHGASVPIHRLARRWHRWVARSEMTLKLLSHADTGAFVAAPTTSVPEWPGGERNWDYRFVWIRDAAFAAQAMLQLGHRAEATAFLRWALSRGDPALELRTVYGAHGETDLAERTLPYLSGLWDSRPVRIGNAAARQFQLDVYGELMDAALLLPSVDPGFLSDHWADLVRLADHVVDVWRLPDRGIWEIRGDPRQYVHSKLMAWVALDRAVRLAATVGTGRSAAAWEREAGRIRSWVRTVGFDPARGSYRQAEGSAATDAANLRIPLVGFLPYDDPSVVGTVRRIQEELAEGPFVYRYRTPDGLRGPEGAFLPASFWLVECLARGGREREAGELWDGTLRAGTRLGLFSEEFDPGRGLRLGNFPQALTHIGVLRAAIALGEAEAHRGRAASDDRPRDATVPRGGSGRTAARAPIGSARRTSRPRPRS